ncbi:hypothetical protein HYS99_00765 [Candidatus Giovannonibacteria bacterium]|nr:hypothetical protein [Candidatus Giovannonibacteria bacterium]
MRKTNAVLALLFIVFFTASCTVPAFTTREKSAGVGVASGALVGGLVAGPVGLVIGGAAGLAGGALVGDQIQIQEDRQRELEQENDSLRKKK